MLRLDQYRPHVARAALLSHRMGLRAARAATEAMQTIGLPAAMLDAAGRVLSANAGLEALQPRITTGLLERIQLADRDANQLLHAALQHTVPSVRSIPIPAGEHAQALIAHVLPIRRAAGDIFRRAAALLVITPVTAPRAPLTEVLTGLFDLTPAEVRVARGIAQGQTLEEICTALGLSRETVRTQLKSVLAKTGTSRQTELALLLSGTSTPSAAGGSPEATA
jgi:DNA-binding CsgD family transcriptional regulator